MSGETKQQVTQRKIRNGLRKQAEAVQKEKEKVWDILKTDTSKSNKVIIGRSEGYYYCPYIPVMSVSRGIEPVRIKDFIVNTGDTTA